MTRVHYLNVLCQIAALQSVIRCVLGISKSVPARKERAEPTTLSRATRRSLFLVNSVLCALPSASARESLAAVAGPKVGRVVSRQLSFKEKPGASGRASRCRTRVRQIDAVQLMAAPSITPIAAPVRLHSCTHDRPLCHNSDHSLPGRRVLPLGMGCSHSICRGWRSDIARRH